MAGTTTLYNNAQIQKVTLGNGSLLIGSPLKDVGPIKGNAVLDITRKVLPFKAGIPQLTYKNVATDEDATFKATLASFDLDIMTKVLGVGTFTTVAVGTVSASAQIAFNDPDGNANNIGLLLGAHDLLASPAPVVKNAATGTLTYAETTDYVIDYTNGMITRTANSAIQAKEAVTVTFSYTAQASELYSFGGLSLVNYLPGQFIHPREDGLRIIVDMFRMSTMGKLMLEYREVEWDLFDCQWTMLADLPSVVDQGAGKPPLLFGRQSGALYFQIRREFQTGAG